MMETININGQNYEVDEEVAEQFSKFIRRSKAQQEEITKLRKAFGELIEESDDYLVQNKCGCQHPSCRSCDNDRDLREQIAQANVSLSE